MMSASSAGQRFIDYFVVCGLDNVSGLEPDQLLGMVFKLSLESLNVLNSSKTALKTSLNHNALVRFYNRLYAFK